MGENHMRDIYVKDIIDKCNGKLFCGNKDKKIENCIVNSCIKTSGGTFFGIKGSKVNGSLYYKEAFDNGANVCIISNVNNLEKRNDDKVIIIVDDVLETLKKIAAYKRSLFTGDVIGITGSVGKTSTKEIIASVLSKKYKVLKTIGNQNSQIGLPLTILRLTDEDVMVLEMGMSKKGEMHNLSLIAKPTISVITNVLDAHIGNLGSRQNILKAKLEILDGMNDGILIINNDNDMLFSLNKKIKDNINIITYGIESYSNYMPTCIKEGKKSTFNINDIENIVVNGGKTFIYNALSAFIIGKLLNVEKEDIKEGINNHFKEKHRLELISLKNNITLIDDTYNASYNSIKGALEYIKQFKKERKIAVLADILELGKETKKVHKNIGSEVIKNDIDILITIGKYSKKIKKEAKKLGMKRKNLKHFKTEKKARCYIKSLVNENDVILVKGSNDMGLINLVEYLKEGLVF